MKPMQKSNANRLRVAFRPKQPLRTIESLSAEAKFLEHYPKKYSQMHSMLLSVVEKLSKKAAKQGLSKEERKTLNEALRSMHLLEKKFLQRYLPRVERASLRTTHDPKFRVFLTDAFFKERLFIEAKRPGSLALLDIDRMKRINDVYGHAVGDIVIASIGEALQTTFGAAKGLVGRHGGEEILVWAPMDPEKLAELLNKALLKAQMLIAQRTKEEHVELSRPPTFSAGIVQFCAPATREKFKAEYGASVRAADSLMYSSKRSGRNAYTLTKAGKSTTHKFRK